MKFSLALLLLSILTPAAFAGSPAPCLGGDEEDSQIEALTKAAYDLPKALSPAQEQFFFPYLQKNERVEKALREKARFQEFLLAELNTDSLLVQQMLPALNDEATNGRSQWQFRTYLRADGKACKRLPFKASAIGLMGLEKASGDQYKVTFFAQFSVGRKGPGTTWRKQIFSMTVAVLPAEQNGDRYLKLVSYPNFLEEKFEEQDEK